jgi:hypothetical protein
MKRLWLTIREIAWTPVLAVLVALGAIASALLGVDSTVVLTLSALALVLSFLSLKE